MKFLLCFVLCLAAAQATHLRSAVTYAAPYTTYTAAVLPAPAVYTAPLPLTYSTGVGAAPIVYGSVGVGGHIKTVSPVVYAAPSVHSTVVKKEVHLG